MDAALVSYSHRWRLYWTSFFGNDMIPQIRDNLHLNQVLDKDHVARTAIYSDTSRYMPANTEGIMMTKYDRDGQAGEKHTVYPGRHWPSQEEGSDHRVGGIRESRS